MKRRNFLSFIPAASALPIIGTNIVMGADKIEIFNPKPITPKDIASHPEFDFKKCKIQIVQDDYIMGEGYITQLEISREPIFSDGGIIRGVGPSEITVSGTLFDLIYPFKP